MDRRLLRHVVRLGLSPDTQWASITLRRISRDTVGWAFLTGIGARRLGPPRKGQSAITWKWPERWATFEVQLFGAARRLDRWPVEWPAYVPLLEGEEPKVGDEAIELLLQTAHLPECTPYAEIRWIPGEGAEPAVRGTDLPGVKPEDILRAAEGVHLLNQITPNPGGRRRGVTALGDREETRDALIDACRSFVDRKRRKPLERELFEVLGLAGNANPSKQFRRWLRAAGFRDFEDLLGAIPT